jgi:hypothetical protein
MLGAHTRVADPMRAGKKEVCPMHADAEADEDGTAALTTTSGEGHRQCPIRSPTPASAPALSLP